ncbi:glycosyltransferase family 39 protein [Actinomadura meridiana]|uniref:Glycosyltransferase family 39 protein n=1 Tax=Actinomadura meridiana TaxID=559626 RepID=A0ABP8CFB5_9ACTN
MTTGELERQRPRLGPVRRSKARLYGWIAVAIWALLLAGVFIVGDHLKKIGLATEDDLPPLHASTRLLTWQIVPTACLGAALAAVLPSLTQRLSWRRLLPASWIAAVLWTVALAMTDGLDAIHRPLDAPTEYPVGIAAIQADGPAQWLRTFTERLGGYTTHVRGHPPLPTLMLWALDETGLHGTAWSSALIIAAGTSAIVAIAITVRHIAGETLARRALPFLILAPLTLWIATSMDAFFLGVGAWATALTAIASKRTNLPAAAGAGLLLGTLPYLSYGLLSLLAVPLAVVVLTRPSRRVLTVLLCCAAIVPLAFTAGGFWWPDGVAATHETYLISRGSAQRSYTYFVIANFAVLALQIGPATAHALPTMFSRRSPLTWLVGAALAGVVALDVSGVTRGEVERIWIPYAAWIVLATAAHAPPARRWLAAQAALTLAIQALVLSPW